MERLADQIASDRQHSEDYLARRHAGLAAYLAGVKRKKELIAACQAFVADNRYSLLARHRDLLDALPAVWLVLSRDAETGAVFVVAAIPWSMSEDFAGRADTCMIELQARPRCVFVG